MSEVLSDFLDFFNLSSLLEVSSEITVAQYLGLLIVCMVAVIITVVMIRVVMEFIKMFVEWGRFK